MATLKMCLFLERERDLRPGGRSGAALVTYVGGLGPLLCPMLSVLGRSWTYVGGLGLLLAPKLAVFGSFQDLSGRSWDAFGPK